MNWFKKQLIDWALRQQERKKVEMSYRPGALETTVSSRSEDMFDGVEQIRLTIFNVSNGTLVRMDSRRPEDDYVVRHGGPRRPPVFIVKDGETVQDVIVRQLAIAALERA